MKTFLAMVCVLGLCTTFFQQTKSEPCFAKICKFTLKVTQSRSMTFRPRRTFSVYDVELQKNGTLSLVPNNFHLEVPDVIVTPEMVHTADGSKARNIILVNGLFPGPTLEVMEGAEVTVKVVNKLEREGIAIHWHGMYLRNNVWMDGVPYVTQCPILPRQSFTYRFIADPAGTHFYHSHNDFQKLDGLYGALIVHRRKEQVSMPYFTAVISDWFPVPSTELQVLFPYDRTPGTGSDRFNHRNLRGVSFDGVDCSIMEYYSGLINGRGRNGNNSAPLTVFRAIRGQRHRMHIISAAGEFAYRVSIDKHMLTVIESDGQAVNPLENLESVIVFPGERYVIEFETSLKAGKYWVRAKTLRFGKGNKNPVPDGTVWEVKAILQLGNESSVNQDPRSQRKTCTLESPCKILNCPWQKYRKDYFPNMECLDVSALTLDSSRQQHKKGNISEDNNEVDVELFLNMAFPFGPSITSRKMVMPSAPLFQEPSTWQLVPCKRRFPRNADTCSNIINLPFNKTVQLVLLSDIFGGLQAGTSFGNAGKTHHPMHFHGHNFRVLKIGYPIVDNVTRMVLRGNKDIKCNWKKDKKCMHPYWAPGHPRGLNLKNPPLKDTVVVPAMGYTVVRFETTNPGYWLFHCHLTVHNFNGMGLIFNITNEPHPPVPPGFPTCRNFDIPDEVFNSTVGKLTMTSEAEKQQENEDLGKVWHEDVKMLEMFATVSASLSSVSFFLQVGCILLLLLFYKRMKLSLKVKPTKENGSTRLNDKENRCGQTIGVYNSSF